MAETREAPVPYWPVLYSPAVAVAQQEVCCAVALTPQGEAVLDEHEAEAG